MRLTGEDKFAMGNACDENFDTQAAWLDWLTAVPGSPALKIFQFSTSVCVGCRASCLPGYGFRD
jgi:hypothetical protein